MPSRNDHASPLGFLSVRSALQGVLWGLFLAISPFIRGAEKEDLSWMDLEQLGKIKVTTAAKRPEPAWTAGSALTVITAEDISFGGADSLTAALRYVPGLDVAQIDARNWAVSARGFNAQYSNKLLVMVDGRSIYTPLFGGVLWDTPDTPLEDLSRIEVVRGPGGALWGANAVNGVINFVTAPASLTLGTLVVAEAGSTTRRGLLREGFTLLPEWTARFYAQATEREPTLNADGTRANDRWRMDSAGFRADGRAAKDILLTFSGEAYAGHGGETQAPGSATAATGPTANADSHGGHLLVKADHHEADGTGSMGQFYFDATRIHTPIAGERRQTFDADFQHDRAYGETVVSFGTGLRLSQAHTIASGTVFFSPPDASDRIANAFLQAQLPFVPKKAEIVVGAKVEHSNTAGTSLQPSARVVWRVDEGQTLWSSLSRAVRSPSFLERAVRYDAARFPPGAIGAGSPATLIRWVGSASLGSETVVAAEAGWRIRLGQSASFDASLFLNRYDRLVDIMPGPLPLASATAPGAVRVWPWNYLNALDGIGYGTELAVTWHPTPRSQLNAGYTFTRIEQSGAVGGLNEAYFESSTPRHSGFIRFGYGFHRDWALHLEWRAVGPVEAVGVRGYAALDARIVWRATPQLQVALAGENLTDPSHPEFRNGGNLVTTELRRGGSIKVTWRQ